MDTQRVEVFLAEYDRQLAEIGRIYKVLAEKLPRLAAAAPPAEAVESVGYWLHNLYCAWEDLFRRVASYFENSFPPDGRYHRALLQRMTLAIEGVRPPVLGNPSLPHLDELHAFRHVFRHAYSYGLDDERVLHLLRRALAGRDSVMDDLARFRREVETGLVSPRPGARDPAG